MNPKSFVQVAVLQLRHESKANVHGIWEGAWQRGWHLSTVLAVLLTFLNCIVADSEVTLTLFFCGLVTVSVCYCSCVFWLHIFPYRIAFLTPSSPNSKLIYILRFSFRASQKNKLLDWICTFFKDINLFFSLKKVKLTVVTMTLVKTLTLSLAFYLH